MEIIKKIFETYSQIVFPSNCICCGCSTHSESQHICSLCRRERFESAWQMSNEIVPLSVNSVHSMWFFDKGGYLQNLLHKLKYQNLKDLGLELGYLLGDQLLRKPFSDMRGNYPSENPLLIPVPLHKRKRRKRGYNQARAVSEGVSITTGWEILNKEAAKRIKTTRTQTGLTIEQRSENVKNAFQITQPEVIKDRKCMIVDDVFTTGATTFELAKTIFDINNIPSDIVTIARA